MIHQLTYSVASTVGFSNQEDEPSVVAPLSSMTLSVNASVSHKPRQKLMMAVMMTMRW